MQEKAGISDIKSKGGSAKSERNLQREKIERKEGVKGGGKRK